MALEPGLRTKGDRGLFLQQKGGTMTREGRQRSGSARREARAAEMLVC